MDAEILQVRGVAGADLDVLRARAASAGQSLSAYIRDLLHDEARRQSNTEVIARIAGEEPLDIESEEIHRYIEAERSW